MRMFSLLLATLLCGCHLNYGPAPIQPVVDDNGDYGTLVLDDSSEPPIEAIPGEARPLQDAAFVPRQGTRARMEAGSPPVVDHQDRPPVVQARAEVRPKFQDRQRETLLAVSDSEERARLKRLQDIPEGWTGSVFYGGENCPPCRIVKRDLRARGFIVEPDSPCHFRYVHLKTTEEELARGLEGVPTFMFYLRGVEQVQERVTGYGGTKAELDALLAKRARLFARTGRPMTETPVYYESAPVYVTELPMLVQSCRCPQGGQCTCIGGCNCGPGCTCGGGYQSMPMGYSTGACVGGSCGPGGCSVGARVRF